MLSGGTSDVTDTYTGEFADVPIPRDMSANSGNTDVSDASGQRVGYMQFSGSVEWRSLIDACAYNMYTQGWSPLAIFKKPNGLLVFQKDQRICTISISKSITGTVMHVWVTPKMNGFTVPPTMPVAPAPVEADEIRESGSSDGDSYEYKPSESSSGGDSYSSGGVNEQGLSE